MINFAWRSKQILFLSKDAVFNASKAIRGGIPICWPQFGPRGNLPAHGFARTTAWTFEKAVEREQETIVSFTLKNQVSQRAFVLREHVT